MSDLATQILLQIQEEQVNNARMMGAMAADVKTLVTNSTEYDTRITSLENKAWKQTGFFSGVILAGEPVIHYIAKKFGWL